MAEGDCSENPKFSLVTSRDPHRHELWQARQQGNFSDFQLEVNGSRILCHKVILSAHSEYFSRMFQHENTVEVTKGSVDLKLLDVDAVTLVVDFMYSGRIEFEYDMMHEVVKVVNYFQLTETVLEKKTSKFIINHLSTDNCLGWFSFGEQINLKKIKRAAHAIMLQQFSEVCIGFEFVGLSFDRLTPYIQKVIKRYSNHDQCLKAFVTWAMHDASERSQKFGMLLQIVNLSKCSARVLKDIYTKNGKVLLNNFDLLQQFTTDLSQGICEPTLDVIVAGGCVEDDVCNRKTWLLNLESGSCTEKASQAKGAFFPATCALPEGLIKAGGGSLRGSMYDLTTDCVLYHRSTDTWVELPSLPGSRWLAGATCVQDTFVMVVGGGCHQKKQAVYLDLRTKRKWTICDDMPKGMELPIVGSINDCVYVIFSTIRSNCTADFYEIPVQCYNTTAGTWTIKSPLPESIQTTCGARAVTIAGQLYLIGGVESLCAKYDPTCDNWTILASPQYPHLYGAALVMNDKILLSGGKIDGKIQDIIEEYDRSNNSWRLLPVKLPAPLDHHSMILG